MNGLNMVGSIFFLKRNVTLYFLALLHTELIPFYHLSMVSELTLKLDILIG